MELFLSTFVNRVDRKGRVSVPATFRSTLATHRLPNQVVLMPSFKYEAIDGTGSDHLAEMMEGLATLDQYSDRRDDLTLVFADSRSLQIDGDGRIVLPDDLKSHAHIDGEVAFVGLGRMFQMWEPGRFTRHRTAARERSRRDGATIPSAGR
ncbi:MAG: division/cell wall cluster transcriptional repressor MraZ [Alphaproteobacteria bacterium]|nr:division/cell wall cluster transcriptional repressor MraZ [Alphaproteobacteria bacterium]MBV9554126.1 division/cell wall cluster transcriptional repressor MraZ [Alphaproteobacteria bacterium]